MTTWNSLRGPLCLEKCCGSIVTHCIYVLNKESAEVEKQKGVKKQIVKLNFFVVINEHQTILESAFDTYELIACLLNNRPIGT